jgi:hypothetical protein
MSQLGAKVKLKKDRHNHPASSTARGVMPYEPPSMSQLGAKVKLKKDRHNHPASSTARGVMPYEPPSMSIKPHNEDLLLRSSTLLVDNFF